VRGIFAGVSFPLRCISRVLVLLGIYCSGTGGNPSPSPKASPPANAMDPAPPLSRAKPSTISRHHAVSIQAPKLATSKVFPFGRNRRRWQPHKPKPRTLTAGDRLVQAKKREQHRQDYRDALEQAQAKIRELAEGLRDRFGKYSVEHYFNDLIHRAHKSRSTRKVNPWNAYQKLELERMKRRSPTTSIPH